MIALQIVKMWETPLLLKMRGGLSGHHPTGYEYRLTEKGRDLAPILRAIAAWDSKHAGDE